MPQTHAVFGELAHYGSEPFIYEIVSETIFGSKKCFLEDRVLRSLISNFPLHLVLAFANLTSHTLFMFGECLPNSSYHCFKNWEVIFHSYMDDCVMSYCM